MIAVKSLTAPFILLALTLFVPVTAAQADKTANQTVSQTVSQQGEVTTVASTPADPPDQSTTAPSEQDFVPQLEMSESMDLPTNI
jgi:hypothetical protein